MRPFELAGSVPGTKTPDLQPFALAVALPRGPSFICRVSPSASPNEPFDLLKADSSQAILRMARTRGDFLCGCGSGKHRGENFVESDTTACESSKTGNGTKSDRGKKRTKVARLRRFGSHRRRAAAFAIALAAVAVGAAGAFAADQVPFADQIPLVGSTLSSDSPAPADSSAATDSAASPTDAGTPTDSNTSSATTTSTDSSANSPSATSGANTNVANRYIVTFADGVTEA